MIEIKSRWNGAVFYTSATTTDVAVALKEGANLIGANLIGANLIGANLIGADLIGANLIGADLRGADLREANLRGANLRGADLRGADLREANLRDANLIGANLIGANLIGADFSEKHLPVVQIGGSKHWITMLGPDRVYIGCQSFPLSVWLEKYEAIGEEHEYTAEEIEEYSDYLQLLKRRVEADVARKAVQA